MERTILPATAGEDASVAVGVAGVRLRERRPERSLEHKLEHNLGRTLERSLERNPEPRPKLDRDSRSRLCHTLLRGNQWLTGSL